MSLLVVEDDPHYARILVDLARDQGFKALVAPRGDEAHRARPAVQSHGGFARHLPARHARLERALSSSSRIRRRATSRCRSCRSTRTAATVSRAAPSRYLTKPSNASELEAALTRIKAYAAAQRKRLLVVEDNAGGAVSIAELLGHDDLEITLVATGAEALAVLRARTSTAWCSTCACPTSPASRSSKQLRDDPRDWRRFRSSSSPAASSPPAEDARTPRAGAERRGQGRGIAGAPARRDRALPPSGGRPTCRRGSSEMLDRLHRSDEFLVGKPVLVVDDDVRNIFALSSVLERRGMTVLLGDHRPRGDRDPATELPTSRSCSWTS